jgi:hypothetical protein
VDYIRKSRVQTRFYENESSVARRVVLARSDEEKGVIK